MRSPVLPSHLDAAVPSVFANICSAFKSMFLLGPLMKQWWTWAFTSSGEATPEFKALFASIGVPTGGVIFWPLEGFTPSGFLVANGQIVSKAAYPDLFALYGTTWGGDGVTTFGLPNMADRFALGASGVTSPGSTGGSATVSLVEANNGPHTHRAVAADQGEFAYNTAWGSSPDSSTTGKVYPNDHGLAQIGTQEVPIATTLEESGNGAAFSVLPPYFAGHWLVKT